MKTWITDSHGNRCSVEYWGSKESAQKALDSLDGCSGCYDCSRCSGCSGCYDCSRCSGCSGCYGCYGCSRCSGCYGCSRCSGCYGCSDCSGCYGCSDCSRCSGLTDAAPTAGINKAVEVPKIPNIHQAVYEAASNPKALNMATCHSCETTHCRAGWVVTLAGVEGRKLESRFDTLLAAMKIYDASDPSFKINPCRFFDTNEVALEDMKKLAEGERTSS